MSRHPINRAHFTKSHDSENSEYYIQFIAGSATPKAMTLPQTKNATQNDPTLQQAAHTIQQNLWHMLDTENFAHQTDVDLHELKLLRNVKMSLLFLMKKSYSTWHTHCRSQNLTR